KIVTILSRQGYKAVSAKSRLENRQDVEDEIKQIQPSFIINAAGKTGKPNVDWCESHKQETIRANIIGALNLADTAFQNNIHMINLGTGCIYEYDSSHPVYSGKGYTEADPPNFHGSFYSHTKVMLDDLLQTYPNVLNLRLRMPISDDLSPRNFITKISRYEKIINIPNSMTVLHDLLPLIPEMAKRRLTGTYNFTNPGTISHNEVLDLYKQYINPSFRYKNFTIEEQNKILSARRSNNELDVSKLLQEFHDIPHIQQSMIQVFKRMQKNLKKGQ
ncbi:MAG: NAD-dependent epimerase/dehydratase family protein, partial [Nitrososphaeraceae archaeon]|nr:NAD-dependent epimerase/dehydratase family protein [Nitrososphaeraceae archaeon]